MNCSIRVLSCKSVRHKETKGSSELKKNTQAKVQAGCILIIWLLVLKKVLKKTSHRKTGDKRGNLQVYKVCLKLVEEIKSNSLRILVA